MKIDILTLIRRISTAAILALGLLAAQHAGAATLRTDQSGLTRIYDDNGYDRGASWCRSGGAATRCDYYTLDQCRQSGSPNYICVPNPWSNYVKPAPEKFPLR